MTRLSKRRGIKIVCAVLCLMVMALGMIWTRAFVGSMKAYRQGAASLETREYMRAVTYFDRSMHWYTPFNPYVEKSAQRLWEIGRQAETRGDIRLSLIALRSIRQSFYAARSLYVPGREWIRKAEAEIARVSGQDRGKREADGPSTGKSAGREMETAGNTDSLWTLILEVGLLGWLGSVVALIVFVFQDKERSPFSRASFYVWGGLAAILFFMWIIGMMKA